MSLTLERCKKCPFHEAYYLRGEETYVECIAVEYPISLKFDKKHDCEWKVLKVQPNL